MTGESLRALRTSRGWTLRQLAAAAGCSASFLSQIEQGKTSPSLVSIKEICRALGLTIAEFLQLSAGRHEVKVIHRGDPSTVVYSWPRASLRYLLPPTEQTSFSILVLEMPAHGGTPWRAARRSMNETGIILRGEATLEVANQTHRLQPSDAVHFDLLQRHRWSNPGRSATRVLLLNANFTEVIDEVAP